MMKKRVCGAPAGGGYLGNTSPPPPMATDSSRSIDPYIGLHSGGFNGGKQGDLASVHSSGENQFIRQLGGADRLWLGGRRSSDCQACTDFTWSDGSAWDYENWDRGEPNNYFLDEDCTELYTQGAAWNDDHCSLFSSPFVCKKGLLCGSTVNCGHHRASDCSKCPWDVENKRNYGAQWCKGDCSWRYGRCVRKY